MVTIKLKKPTGPAKEAPHGEPARSPVRGSAVKGSRPTLAQAQAQRAEREARYQEQLRQRFGERPPENFSRRGEPPRPSEAFSRRAEPTRPSEGFSRRAEPPRPTEGFARRTEPPRPQQQRRDESPRRTESFNRPEPLRRSEPPRRGEPTVHAPPRREPVDRGPVQQRTPFQREGLQRAPIQREPIEREPVQRSPSSRAPTSRGQAPRGAPQNNELRPQPPRYEPRPDPRRQAPPARSRDDDDDDYVHTEHPPGSLRLSKRMSELGIASRREADEWIAKGYVRVDDQIVSALGSRVMPHQRITIDAKAKFQQAQRVTVLVNKPVGYVSGQAEDGYEPAVVLVTPDNQWREDRSGTRFLREHLKSLVPAGRLDIDSVGLLILTQDGRVAKQLIGEDSEVEKEYLVRVATKDGAGLPEAALELLRHGLELDGEALRPAHVEWVNDDQLRFVLKQGKKRQIRRMCEEVGLQVLGLKRVRIGQVMLGDLPPGQWRYLRADEHFISPIVSAGVPPTAPPIVPPTDSPSA